MQNQNIKISLLMPSRERLEQAQRFIQSLEDNCHSPANIELLVYIDDDDKKTKNLFSNQIILKKYIGKQLSMGGYNSFLLKKSTGDIIMLVNDDIEVKTQNWDKYLRKLHVSFKDKIYLMFPNDLNKKNSNATFPIISKKTAQTLLYPFPEQYSGAFIDTHLYEVFKRLEFLGEQRMLYLENIKFEHLHFRKGKGEKDNVYLKRDRFIGDDQFHSLKKMRFLQSLFVYNEIRGIDYIKIIDKTCFEIKLFSFLDIINQFHSDYGLKFSWKLKKCIYYCLRKLYSKLFK